MSRICFIYAFIFLLLSGSSQTPKADSLLKLVNTVPDNRKSAVYNELAGLFRTSDPDKTIEYATKAIEWAERTGNKKEKGYALSSLGFAWLVKSNYNKTTEVESEAISIGKELNDPKLLGACYNTLGLLNEKTGNISKATDNYVLAIRFRETAKDTNGVAATLNNLGQCYSAGGLYLKAIESLHKAEELYLSTRNKNGLGSAYANIGGVYLYVKKYNSAIYYYEKALKLRKETHNNRGLAIVLSNLAELYIRYKNPEKAIHYAYESIDLAHKINDPELSVSGHISLAQAYEKINNLDSAEIAIIPAIDSSLKYDIKQRLLSAEHVYSEILLSAGKPVEAYKHLSKAITIKDSIFTNQASEKIAFLQAEVDKQKREAEVKLIEQKDRIQKVLLLLSILMLVIIALFLLNRYRIKNRSAQQLADQNKIIEQKNKEISDSINYAKRIQRAMLPLVKDLARVFPEGFGIYLPKDVVSGDFYWFLEHGNKHFIAVADCTGHGVPGAFMSMLAADKLTHAVNYKNLLHPSDILSELNNGIKTSLKQNESDSELRDGLDIALCCFEFNSDRSLARLEYAGANRPLYVVSNGKLTEYKATKAAVGGLTENNFNYVNNVIDLKKGNTVYMFSDGYVDQFGGPDEKKFSSKRLRETLINIRHLSMSEQEQELLRLLDKWVNYAEKKYEQVDDILLMGIRV